MPEVEIPAETKPRAQIPAVQPAGSGGTKDEPDWIGKIASLFVPVIVAVVVFAPIIATWLGIGTPKLEIVTAAERADNEWVLQGRVLHDGEPVGAADIWAIASDERGNRFSPVSAMKTNLGGFIIRGVPYMLGGTNGAKTIEVAVFAKAVLPAKDAKAQPKPAAGKEVLTLGERGGIRWVQLPIFEMITIPCIFVASLFLALAPTGGRGWMLRFKYFGLIVMAFFMTAMMVYSISKGLRAVNAAGSKAEVLSLGFANVHHGSYVKGVTAEWLFSLTAPEELKKDVQGGNTDKFRGFGAPLWVLLMAVLGAGLFTISIIVKGIKTPVKFDDEGLICERAEEIARHQFYMLFAPLGAIFVYQLLVAAGAASEAITIAVTVLAAGASLNYLLDMAVKKVQALKP